MPPTVAFDKSRQAKKEKKSSHKEELVLKRGSVRVLSEDHLELAAIGMESEFKVMLDEVEVRPEDIFGSPKAFIRGELMHRVGTSYHLPTGGAVYFDTGVIEVATPVIEIDRGCAARCGRSLWEAILFLRAELDEWEKINHRKIRLVGFSTHYNISFELPHHEQGINRTVKKLALLLTYILPFPVMILAANKRSTGIGVRPRGNRIEITADFTPSASLMIATATLITGIVRAVMKWPSFDLEMLREKSLYPIDHFKPMPHTSRKGWLARYDCYDVNPFTTDIDAHVWTLRDGKRSANPEVHSLREIALRIFSHFYRDIARISDPFTFRLISSVLNGHAPSLLELNDRPAEYEHVGKLCKWDNLFSDKKLSRSRYERVLIHAITGDQLSIQGEMFTPVGMKGWSRVVFRREQDGSRHIFSIDYLVTHLEQWARGIEAEDYTSRKRAA